MALLLKSGGIDRFYLSEYWGKEMSREAIIWTIGAWFGGSLVGLIMSIVFGIILSRMER